MRVQSSASINWRLTGNERREEEGVFGVARGGREGGDGLGRQAGAVLCYFPLSGLASFSKERGLGRRGVSTSTLTLPLHYTRAPLMIGQVYPLHAWLAVAGIYNRVTC